MTVHEVEYIVEEEYEMEELVVAPSGAEDPDGSYESIIEEEYDDRPYGRAVIGEYDHEEEVIIEEFDVEDEDGASFAEDDFEEITVEDSLGEEDRFDFEPSSQQQQQQQQHSSIKRASSNVRDSKTPTEISVSKANEGEEGDKYSNHDSVGLESTALTIDSTMDDSEKQQHSASGSPPPRKQSQKSGKSSSSKSSSLHYFLDKSDWHGLLAAVEALKTLDKAKIESCLCEQNKKDTTPVHTAVWKTPVPLAKLLISIIPFHSRETVLTRKDADGNTPLHLACANLELKGASATTRPTIDCSIVETLGMGAPETHEMRNLQGDIPLHLLVSSPAFQADPTNNDVGSAAEKIVKSILQSNPGLAHIQNKNGATPLHAAIGHGAYHKVQHALIDSDVASVSDNTGMLPIHYVASCKHEKGMDSSVAAKLMSLYPKGIIHQSNAGDTPLHLLVINAKKKFGKTDRNTSKVKKLVEALAGKDDNEKLSPLLVKNRDALTPLHCCALFKTPAEITRRLMKSKVALKASLLRDQHGATPLHLACASSTVGDNIDIVQALGNKQAATRKDNIGRTPLHIAAENKKTTRALVKALVDIDPRPTKMETIKGRMPLHVAIRRKADGSVIRALLKVYPKAVKTTLSGGNTVLHEACQYGISTSALKAIITANRGAAKETNKVGNIPLHIAAAYQSPLDVIEALVDAYPEGAMVQNKNDDVPLHYATSQKSDASSDAARLLAEVGPEAVIMENRDGNTPLDTAKTSKMDSDIIGLLKTLTKDINSTICSSAHILGESSVSEASSIQLDEFFNSPGSRDRTQRSSSNLGQKSISSLGTSKSKRSTSRSRRNQRTGSAQLSNSRHSRQSVRSSRSDGKDVTSSRSRSKSMSKRKSRSSSKPKIEEDNKSSRKERSTSKSKSRSKSPSMRRRSMHARSSTIEAELKTPSSRRRSCVVSSYKDLEKLKATTGTQSPENAKSRRKEQSKTELFVQTPLSKRHSFAKLQHAPMSAPLNRSRSAGRASKLLSPQMLPNDQRKNKTPMTADSRRSVIRPLAKSIMPLPLIVDENDTSKVSTSPSSNEATGKLGDMLSESLGGL